MASLQFDGTKILWIENGKVSDRFDATSGMPGFQTPGKQCVKDAGPIPEGNYVLRLRYNQNLIAVVADAVSCKLMAAQGIQQIPDGDPKEGTAHCTPYWNNWGSNRVRIDAYDTRTRNACRGARSGFYIHDSAKGFTHGCIEVKNRFFRKLYELVNSNPDAKSMLISIDYSRTKTTLGNTKS